MKITHLITSINRGGAENHLYDLAVSQQKANNNVEIIYFKGNGYWKNDLKKNMIKVTSFNPNFSSLKIINYFFFFFKLAQYIRLNKTDILHAHLPLMEIFARLLSYFIKKDYVLIITKHLDNYCLRGSNHYSNSKSYLSILIEKWIFSKCDKYIAISKSVRSFFIKKVGLSQSSIKVIYYGIDQIAPIRGNIKKKLLITKKKKDTIILGTIARLVSQKKIDITLKALSILKENNIKFKYYILGEGPLLEDLKNLAKNLNIHNEVIFLGYSDDVKAFIKKIDIFCLSSDHEGLGLVLLESMINGVPVICSNFGAAREIISNKKLGLLFKRGNHLDMSRKLLKILNKSFRKKLSLNSKKYAIKNYNLQKCLKETKKLYKIELMRYNK